MPWSRTKNGDWLVDYDALYAVFRGAEFARLSHHYTDIESKQSWWGPKTYNAVTDLERVKREVNASAHRKFEHFKPILNDKPETAFRLLANMMDQARYDRNRLKEKRQRALTSTMQNISASVDTYENRIAWAKFTQKTSLIALTILPTMGTSAVGATGFWAASTGVRMTAVAGTAGLQGYSTYQNSTNTSHHGKVGEAVLSGTTHLVLGTISLGKLDLISEGARLSRAEKYVLVFAETGLDASLTGTKALVEGKKSSTALRQSLTSAGIKVSGDAIEGMLPFSNTALEAGAKMVIKTVGDGIIDYSGQEGAPGQRPVITGELTTAGLPERSQQSTDFIKSHVLRRSP